MSGIQLVLPVYRILEHQNDPDIDIPYEESHTSAQGGGADGKCARPHPKHSDMYFGAV